MAAFCHGAAAASAEGGGKYVNEALKMSRFSGKNGLEMSAGVCQDNTSPLYDFRFSNKTKSLFKDNSCG